ncbi:glycosyl hydrolase family 18 protein [Clostridium manihotivorum]|uniref:chitinase n=1 Tax=Clostridium manihotivorum TaxID=2320868 RepID=A0A3R5THL6_9CLOT|nr:glycosyl hydrolase family 18 protein [Clostridium manihotivorum]QAA33654.1 glycoside hydrolase [Clostridium manihotivorum]
MKKISIKKIISIAVSLSIAIPALAGGKVSATTNSRLITQAADTKRFVVYFPNWAMYNVAHNSMSVDNIPWDKVTVVNHAFFTVDSNYKIASTDEYADYQAAFPHSGGWNPGELRGHFGEYKYYKSLYPNVKLLVSIGGWTRGENFHAMASSSANRATFINSVISFLKQYPFIDGIDIDWEYPGVDRSKDPNDQYDRGCPGGPEDKENYTALMHEIRQAYNSSGLSGKLLTIAAPGGYDKVDLTQPDQYSQYLDWINVMTYDIHGAFENTTNHQSAIYANPNDPSPTTPVDIKNKYNTDYIMKYFVNKYQVPANKLNAGSPFYSRGWKNVDKTTGTNGLFAKASGAPVGNLDDPSNPGGQNSYGQMLQLENTTGYVKYRDSYSKVPWLYNSSLGVMYTYEDAISAAARCDYVINNGFGGIIAWDISDDASGLPLTNTISSKLGIGSTVNPTEPAVPELVSAVALGTSQVNVTWNSVSNATSYDIEIDGAVVTNVNSPYSHKGLAAGSTHSYRVRAINSVGTSAWSSYVSAKTQTSTGVTAWAPNTYYAVGTLVTYNGLTYVCLQSHTSQIGWEPSAVPALWKLQ